MAEVPPRSSNGFSTKFLPGLILGLVVGGLAGAFIPSAMDAVSGPKTAGGTVNRAPAGPVKERDARPAPSAAETKPADEKKPEELKPEEPKPPAPSTPEVPPVTAPK